MHFPLRSNLNDIFIAIALNSCKPRSICSGYFHFFYLLNITMIFIWNTQDRLEFIRHRIICIDNYKNVLFPVRMFFVLFSSLFVWILLYNYILYYNLKDETCLCRCRLSPFWRGKKTLMIISFKKLNTADVCT